MKKLLIFTLIICTQSCVHNDPDVFVDLNKNDSISIFELIDSVSVVKLETNKESLIRKGRAYFHKNRFYFFDSSQQTLFCFNNNGKFLFKINKRGRGPDEYAYAETFAIDPFNDYLMFLVPWGSLICYDLNGCFVSKTKLPAGINAYSDVNAVSKDQLVFFTWMNKYSVYYYSKPDSLIKGCLPTTELHSRVFPPFSQSYYYKDSVYFFNAGINNELINLSDSNQRVYYKWNYGDNNYNESQIDNLLSFVEKSRKERKSIDYRKETVGKNGYPQFYTYVHYETDRFRIQFIIYKTWDNKLNIFFDKESGKPYIFKETTEGICFDKSYFFNNKYCFSIQELTPQIKSIISKDQLGSIESYKPDSDNPLLIVFHLK